MQKICDSAGRIVLKRPTGFRALLGRKGPLQGQIGFDPHAVTPPGDFVLKLYPDLNLEVMVRTATDRPAVGVAVVYALLPGAKKPGGTVLARWSQQRETMAPAGVARFAHLQNTWRRQTRAGEAIAHFSVTAAIPGLRTDSGAQVGESANGAEQPAVSVSWTAAKAFCDAYGYRLPTEAEWEYAARGGTQTRYPCGNRVAAGRGWLNAYDQKTRKQKGLDNQAFPFDNDYLVVAPVGRFRANGFGLKDVIGNAWEMHGSCVPIGMAPPHTPGCSRIWRWTR